jgi:chemotaxis protein CheD
VNNLIIKGTATGAKRYTKQEAIEAKVVNKYSLNIDIIAGEYAIMSDDTGVTMQTVLASCVSIVAYDVKKQITAFNHFLTPIGEGLKFGKYSTDEMFKEMYKLGCEKKDISIKIYGGAKLANLGINSINIGAKNVNFAQDYCNLNKLRVRQQEVGGVKGRVLQIKPFFITSSKTI